MALLPSKYLKSVIALGVQADSEEVSRTGQPMCPIATGFLYAYPKSIERSEENAGFRLWLVTCKHVITGVIKMNKDQLFVRLNKSASREMQTFRTSLQHGIGPDWVLHPTADVAVIPTSWQDLESKGVQWETFSATRNALTREMVEEAGLSEGDEVFILGFPIGWREGKQDYPVVRHGMLAQIQGWLNREHKTFLVDGSGFPGNSGGPVVTQPSTIAIAGTQAFSDACLVGMVTARENHKICADIAENADLIEVVPIDTIDETVKLAMQSEVLAK